mmetsp:Transcript_21962/g.51062  ORF Transcript_21962/g.51062 Transcript_21962/m.51062 type:complete len:200 (-) Transcript_21962:39-638(-)
MSLLVISTACSVFSNLVSSMACSLGGARWAGLVAPPAPLCTATAGSLDAAPETLPLACCAPDGDRRSVPRVSDWEAMDWTNAMRSFAVNLRSLKHFRHASVARLVPSGSSRRACAMYSSVSGAGRTGTPGTAVFLRMPTPPPFLEEATVAITSFLSSDPALSPLRVPRTLPSCRPCCVRGCLGPCLLCLSSPAHTRHGG